MANTLSKNQIEYFKNSKVRDENGNLIVCYHGTQTPGFTEFNPQHSDTSQFGKYKFDKYNVNYFTSDIDVAKGYTELGVGDVEGERKNIYACYLNIENPFIVDNKTESEFKKWSNIKDNRVRDKHITAFEKFAKKWLHTWVDDSDVNAINKDLHFFNHELRPCADVDQDEDAIIYDLWELGNNSFFGAEHEVMRYYYIEELFSEDNYEELRDCLVGNYEEDREDYYYTIDNIVKWVLLMNEEDGTDYDGIIVPDIADVGPKGNPFSPYCTDYITLKSGNQIKDIKNINPTSKYNIHEDAGEKQIKIFKQIYNKIIQAEKYYGTPQWEDLLFSPLHCFIGAVLYAYHYSCKEKQSCIFHLGAFDNTATIISHCWIEDSSGRIHDTRGMSDKSRYNSFIEIPIDTNTDALSIIKLVKAVVERKALIEELKESEIDNMNINEALTKLNSLDESLLQDLHRDNQHIKKVYGEEVYQALQEYCEQGNDLGNVLYTESGWKRFEKWLFDTKGINIKEPNNYQILEDKNELKNRAKKHKKTDKKGAKGWFVNPNAGNVEYNISFFNNAMGANMSSGEACNGLGEGLSPEGYEPKQKGIAYKVFKVKNGELYPPMVANKGGKPTPIGVWLDAEEGEFAGLSKTGRPKVKSTGSGTLAYRPGWHLGDVPRAKQFDRLNKETGEYEFPKDFVWAKCEYAMDIDYQAESDAKGYERTKLDKDGNVITYKSDKYQHSLAGVPHLPKNGSYRYKTNPNPDTVPWVITGQMKVIKILTDQEVNDILKAEGIEPIHRQGGDKTLKELGLNESFSAMGKSLQEALNSNVNIYETEKDGLPEVGREFIAYRTTHKEYEIYTRQDKEAIRKKGWSDEDSYISKDGEFYSGESGYIYPVDYDRYVYVDELKLISPETDEKDRVKQENATKTIKTAFNEVFGSLGDKLATIFSTTNKKGNVEPCFPFSLRDDELDINYLVFEDESKVNNRLIEPMKANNLNDADIEKIFNTIFSYQWGEYYTRKNLATYKQKVLDKFMHKDKKESLKEENLEKEENIIFKGFTIEHFPYKFVGGGKTIEHNSYIIRSPYCLKSPENEDKYYLPLYCENKDGEVINFNTLDKAKEYITKYISKKAGDIKIKNGDEVHFVLNKNLDESKKTEYEELYYPSLDIEIVTREGNPGGYYDSYMGQWYPDYSETEERTIDWTYYVRKEDVENLILEFMEDEGLDTELSPREFADIYDTYFDKYYDKILDAFRDEAIEDAEQNYREEDYIDWDSYRDSFDENLNEINKVEEQGRYNRYFDIEVALRKADLNYNYDYDSKFYFESKSDLEKACHLVRDLGYEKYDRHESDLCLHINPELKEDFEDLDDPYADDIQKFVYKAISALKLRSKADREYYAEMLEHDIRNLRGEEWFEIFDKPKHVSILAELKQLINYEEDEDMDENLKKNLNENQSLISFYHSSNNPNLSYDSLDWNKSSEIGLHVGTKQAAMERNNKYFYEIIVDKSKMKIFKAPYDMNYWYTVELAKKIKDEALFKEISNILYGYIHDREEDAFLESSKAYRDYFFKKGINTISYQNDYEDVESESYILLDKSMIVDVKPKGQTNEQLDESIEKHPTLNPILWDENKKLIPVVNKTLNKIVKAFVDYCAENDVKLNVKDSVIVGSNANYNYTKDSDIDLHLIVDFDDEEQYKLYDAYKRLFNDKYDLTIKDIPVEIYVEKDLNSINSNGIYSLQNEWLKEPIQKEIPDIDEEKLQIELNKYLNKYKNIKPEDAESLIDLLYELRQKALSKQGEYAIGNLVFKEFRNKGYLDELKDLRDKYTSSTLSLA